MAYNQEVASLVLLTSDLEINATNDVGTSNEFMTENTWSNINLRTLLGPMYDKYDCFVLQCINIFFVQYSTTLPFGVDVRDRTIGIYIKGLPFTNNTYDCASKTNQPYALINYATVAAGGATQINRESNLLMFTKNQELADITIFYKSLIKPYEIQTVNPVPSTLFTFNIFGVDKTNRVPDLNSSRLFQ
jgi:hypothetical protein